MRHSDEDYYGYGPERDEWGRLIEPRVEEESHYEEKKSYHYSRYGVVDVVWNKAIDTQVEEEKKIALSDALGRHARVMCKMIDDTTIEKHDRWSMIVYKRIGAAVVAMDDEDEQKAIDGLEDIDYVPEEPDLVYDLSFLFEDVVRDVTKVLSLEDQVTLLEGLVDFYSQHTEKYELAPFTSDSWGVDDPDWVPTEIVRDEEISDIDSVHSEDLNEMEEIEPEKIPKRRVTEFVERVLFEDDMRLFYPWDFSNFTKSKIFDGTPYGLNRTVDIAKLTREFVKVLIASTNDLVTELSGIQV